MKKRNVTSLKLQKSSISNLTNNGVKGGAIYTQFNCPTLQNYPCTSFIDACPTAWCPPTVELKTCPLPY